MYLRAGTKPSWSAKESDPLLKPILMHNLSQRRATNPAGSMLLRANKSCSRKNIASDIAMYGLLHH